jgi:hypothetical protein
LLAEKVKDGERMKTEYKFIAWLVCMGILSVIVLTLEQLYIKTYYPSFYRPLCNPNEVYFNIFRGIVKGCD